VVVARGVSDAAVDVVRTADARGIALAVDHLVDLGHSRIAHIDGDTAPGAAGRRTGYRNAMRRHGLEAHVQVTRGGLTEESGARATRELLDSDTIPTAILAFNDRCATGVLDTLYRHGVHVPQDLSVVGFDDSHLAGSAHIDLTTVRQDAGHMARLAVERAIARLATDARPGTCGELVVPPTLVVRRTTGPAPRHDAPPTQHAYRSWPDG
jgi:DNA-binding LacI/PurR family transcriptional regulator